MLFVLAGIAGLEPTKRESKSRVLPLHHIPTDFQYITHFIICQDLNYMRIKGQFPAYTVFEGAIRPALCADPVGAQGAFL